MSRVPRDLRFLKATVSLPCFGRGGATPGVVFGCGAFERTAQEPGRASLLLETIRQINGAPVTNPPCTARVRGCRRAVAKNKRSHRGRPVARGTRAEAEGSEASEGCIRAMKPGNGWHRSRRSKGGPCRERA